MEATEKMKKDIEIEVEYAEEKKQKENEQEEKLKDLKEILLKEFIKYVIDIIENEKNS